MSRDVFGRATSIIYSFDSGSLPDEYQYVCKVIVRETTVEVIVRVEYGRYMAYHENCQISQSEYNHFMDALANLNIRKMVAEECEREILDGRGSSFITITCADKTLFEANIYDDLLIREENIKDLFVALLPDSMKEAVLHPERFTQGNNNA